VRGAFAAALHASQSVALHEEALTAADEAARVVAAGRGAPEDVARAEIERVRAGLERDEAASLRREALAELTAAVAAPGVTIESVEGSLEAALELPGLEKLLATLDDHPLLKAARGEVEVHEARVRLAEAERIPDVKVELMYRGIEETQDSAFDVGLSITLPLFDSGRGRLEETRAERNAAAARAQTAEGDAVRQLREAHGRLARAMSTVRVMRYELLPRYAELRRATEARHASGGASPTETLGVRQEAIRARLAHLGALRDVMAAWADLSAFVR
jgi:outer membrane protein, heavy metal efflux system